MTPEKHEPAAATRNAIPDSLLHTRILKDIPLFASGSTEGLSGDAFNHEAFATAIFKLLEENEPPLSIGLFGAWGIGKSTILNILKQKIEAGQNVNLKYIYFNAWKYSGDSFRRQFLIEVARAVFGDGHEEVKRLEELNFNAVIKQSQQKNFLAALKAAIADAFKLKFSIKSVGVARFILGACCVVIVAIMSGLLSQESILLASIFSASAIPAVFLWFSNLKFDELFVVQETPIYDPKLVFPEQFESEFSRLIRSEAFGRMQAVIAIDDIDRCESAVIRDVLITTKNFIGQQNCFFVVPCDEKAVVDVFRSDADQAGRYKDESLRKYFNVALRIPPIPSKDLVDFANTVVRSTGLPDGVVQIAILANCRDARKMKHFLNSLTMKYQVAKSREASRLMPEIVDSNLEELAKAVLIEDAFPELYALLVENPRLYDLLEKYAFSEQVDSELKPLIESLSSWDTIWPSIRQVLLATRQVTMPHADILFALKSSNTEARIPRGIELNNAILEGNVDLIRGLVNGIKEGDQQLAVADLLAERLRVGKDLFLRNAIASALRLCTVPELLPASNRLRVGRDAIFHLATKGDQLVLEQNVSQTLDTAMECAPNWMPSLLTKYLVELGGLPIERVPPNIVTTVESLYKVLAWRKQVAKILNEKFDAWVGLGTGLKALEALKLPAGLQPDEAIPSAAVVRKVFQSQALPSSEMETNAIRRDIGYANWNDDLASAFIKLLSDILQQSTGTTYTPEVRFVFQSILLKPEILGLSSGAFLSSLFNNVLTVVNRLTDQESRRDGVNVVSLFAIHGADAIAPSTAASSLTTYWKPMSDEEIRLSLAFLSGPDPQHEALRRQLLNEQFVLLQGERESINERSLARLKLSVESKDVVTDIAIEDLLLSGVEVAADAAFSTWTKEIENYRTELSETFASRVCEKVLTLVPNFRNREERLGPLFELFSKCLASVPVPLDAQLLKAYFKLLVDADSATVRKSAAQRLEMVRQSKESLQPFFSIEAENILTEVAHLTASQLPGFSAVIDALASNPSWLNERSSELLLQIAKKFLSMANTDQQQYGLSVIARTPVIRGEDVGELIYLTINLARTQVAMRELTAAALNRLAPHADHEAQKAAREFLAENGQPNA